MCEPLSNSSSLEGRDSRTLQTCEILICGNGRNYARPGFEFQDVRHSVSLHVSLGDFQVVLMLNFLDRMEWEYSRSTKYTLSKYPQCMSSVDKSLSLFRGLLLYVSLLLYKFRSVVFHQTRSLNFDGVLNHHHVNTENAPERLVSVTPTYVEVAYDEATCMEIVQ